MVIPSVGIQAVATGSTTGDKNPLLGRHSAEFGAFNETPALTAATFANPPGIVRPKYRLWLPLADTDDTELTNQVRALAAAGAGGIETAHAPISDPVTGEVSAGRLGDIVNATNPYLAEYGWGTPLWGHRIEVLEKAAKEANLILDHGAGPRWVPTGNSVYSMNKPEAQKQLIFGRSVNGAGSSLANAGLPTNWNIPLPTVKSGLCGPISPGDDNVKVSSIAGLGEGDTLRIGSGTDAETVKIARIGTTDNLLDDPDIENIASQCTTLANTGSALATAFPQTLFVNSVTGWHVGPGRVTLGNSQTDVGTVERVGTHAAKATTLADSVTAGQETVYVSSVAGLNGGDVFMIGVGNSGEEIRRIDANWYGHTGASAATTTLSDPATLSGAGPWTVKVADISSFIVGDTVVLNYGTPNLAERFYGVVQSIGSSDITITAAPKSARPAGSNAASTFAGDIVIRDIGSGVVLDKGASANWSAAAPVRGFGSGIDVSGSVPAHAAGDSVVHLGTGITVSSALSKTHGTKSPVTMTADKTLVKVVAVQCSTAECPAEGTVNLDSASLTDLTEFVDSNMDTVNYTFPVGNGNPWQLINFNWTADGQAQATNVSPVSTYNADQLSSIGAKAITDTWDKVFEEYPAVKELKAESLDDRGRSAIFQDSLELSANQKWTPDFMKKFETLRGYDATKILPSIANLGRDGTTPSPFIMGNDEKARWDYRQTWSDLYVTEYLTTAEKWAESHGMGWRNQAHGDPIDNGRAGMTMAFSDGEGFNYNGQSPEQAFKVVASGSAMQGQAIIQSECCADDPALSYQTTAEHNLTEYIYRGMAGGSNGIIWHGSPYAGQPAPPVANGRLSFWPGNLQKGGQVHPEAFGPRIPQYNSDGSLIGGEKTAGLRQLNDSLARMQLALRQGKPKYDVGVYYQNLGLINRGGDNPSTLLQSDEDNSRLAQKGYTYSYVSPEFLFNETKDEQGRIASDYTPGKSLNEGTWFNSRGDYKAFVLNLPENQLTLRADAAEKFVEMAASGLPIVINVPLNLQATDVTAPGANRADDATVRTNLTKLFDMASNPSAHPGTNVKRVGSYNQSGIVEALEAFGINPGAEHQSNHGENKESGAIVSVRRQTKTSNYYWFYNQTDASVDQTVTLEGKGRPYWLNSHTGKITPVTQFSPVPGGVTVQVSLGAHDADMMVLTTDDLSGATAPKLSVQIPNSKKPDPVVPGSDEARYSGETPVLRSAVNGQRLTDLSDGTKLKVSFDKVPAPTPITSSWTLSVDSWGPDESDLPGLTQVDEECWSRLSSTFKDPDAPDCISVSRTKHKAVGPLQLQSPDGALPAWNKIPGLRTAAGVGVYSTTFAWQPPSHSEGMSYGAYLDLGAVTDTYDIWVNDTKLPPQNQLDRSRVDVGPYLKAGANHLKIQVATPLFNAQIGLPNTTIAASTPSQDIGLMGPVRLLPYQEVSSSNAQVIGKKPKEK